MVSRFPPAHPLANSKAGVALVFSDRGHVRTVEIGSAWLWGGTVVLSALMLWYLAATLFLVFKDDMFSRMLQQQVEMQAGYEDRLAAMRVQMDRVTSRQLLDQGSIAGKLHELMNRQAQLETRQALMASITEQPAFAGIFPTTERPTERQRAANPMFDPPLTGSVNSFAPIQRRPQPALDTFDLRGSSAAPSATPPTTGDRQRTSALDDTPSIESDLGIAQQNLSRIERRQAMTVDIYERMIRQRRERWSGVLADTGVDAARFNAAKGSADAQGGPLLPLPKEDRNNPFVKRIVALQTAIHDAERLRRVLTTLPLHRPLPKDVDISSQFGVRLDPFTRSPALHAGIDFRALYGSAVRATAGGKVVEAGWVGGYGNLVEIDHGYGITTRYAHLTSIDVDVGDVVTKSKVIGKVGSTGRSTGPHLHYEVRIDGEATDPMRFLKAGQRLGTL
jgi:murein DD-endopeptidase MepM/ murein hydrolase activator NlpD